MVSKASSDKLSCSFCGKSQDDVKKLIAGPSVYICNECVDLCNDIIEEEIKSEEDTSIEQTCLIFKCSKGSLHRWIQQ